MITLGAPAGLLSPCSCVMGVGANTCCETVEGSGSAACTALSKSCSINHSASERIASNSAAGIPEANNF